MGGGGGSARSMPDEQLNQLEEFKRMANNFRQYQSHEEAEETSLEIRGTALVLSGILPPAYTLESTLDNIERVLASGASLFR